MAELKTLQAQNKKLKAEKRTLIGQYNKEKTLREVFEKELKQLKKQLKRGNRNSKKGISTDVSVGTQTVIPKKSISIQTDYVASNETYYDCRKVVEDLVQKSLMREQCIQCNFIEDQDPNEKNIMVRNSKMNDEYYLIKYFRNPKYNTSRVAYINENYDLRFRREMLGVLDMNDDFQYINIDGKLMHSIILTFYNLETKLFDFSYKVIPDIVRNGKSKTMKDILTISTNKKIVKTIKQKLIKLQDYYNLRITYEKQTHSKKYFRIVNKKGASMERIKAQKRHNKERMPKSTKSKLQKEVTETITKDVWVYTFYLNGKVIYTHEFDKDLPMKIIQSNANFDFKFE